MKISAQVKNRPGQHQVTLRTNDVVHSLEIPPKEMGFGSSANGGELLCLALATCYCNDLYREAAKWGIRVEWVEVSVEGEFGGEGEAGKSFTYQAKARAQASEEDIRALMIQTDKVAEIQNTLRAGVPVTLTNVEGISV
jgi:organic hydroperoxide reductase OsmC/OhrA